MLRIATILPDSIAELCLVRIGIQARKLSALSYTWRLGKAIDEAAKQAKAANAGLLSSERFSINWRHTGILQYWRSYDEMEAWSHRSPHRDWWQAALERMRTKGDLGVYHETLLVPRNQIEAIAIDCDPAGIAAFGESREPIGSSTTSRDRLNRRMK